MTSTLSVALLPSLLPVDWLSPQHKTLAVVIDTLRFTSTACVALANGAAGISVVSDIEQARQIARRRNPPAKLCGERHCVRIEGFDFGNSPYEYLPQAVAGHELVFSTTNGTVAVEAAADADYLLLGSLLNRAGLAHTIAARIATDGNATATGRIDRAWLICAGTDGEVALEDVLTAGAILHFLVHSSNGTCRLSGDSARLALSAWQDAQHQSPAGLLAQLEHARGGRNLVEAGFGQDLSAVARLDRYTQVPERVSLAPARFTLAAS